MEHGIVSYKELVRDCEDQRLRAEVMRSEATQSRAVAALMTRDAAAMMAAVLRAQIGTAELLRSTDTADESGSERARVRLECEHALATAQMC